MVTIHCSCAVHNQDSPRSFVALTSSNHGGKLGRKENNFTQFLSIMSENNVMLMKKRKWGEMIANGDLQRVANFSLQ